MTAMKTMFDGVEYEADVNKPAQRLFAMENARYALKLQELQQVLEDSRRAADLAHDQLEHGVAGVSVASLPALAARATALAAEVQLMHAMLGQLGVAAGLI